MKTDVPLIMATVMALVLSLLGWCQAYRQAAYERDVWHWKYDLIDPIRAESRLPLRPFPERPWFVAEKPGVDSPK